MCIPSDSGDVVTLECYEKLIKKDMIHPLNNEKLKTKDIIVMQRVRFVLIAFVEIYVTI